ncbi:MAG: redoxin domain-containing protein [Planctomycetaceae bacterium]|nr:redoxin domain-containing protein [Planctomycetaceae bacterium]
MHRRFVLGTLAIACLSFAAAVVDAAPPPSVETTMKFAPKQRDVDYEIPKPADYPKCKVDGERNGKSFTWVVTGTQGQVLRRFVDSDGDNQFDQYRFYRDGLEVYRDIDSNQNGKVDQFRWLNFGGSRWAIDANEDGAIDQWKSLSAAEASRVAVQSLVSGDSATLQSLMVTAEDLKTLGVNAKLAARLLESAGAAAADARAIVAKSKVLKPDSRWVRFDAQMQGVIPVDEGKARADLYVYENAMAVIESGPAPAQAALVQIGEMIRVGEVWKLTAAPTPIDNTTTTTAGGVLMQPILAEAANDLATAPSPEMQKLIEDLQKLDQAQPQFGVAKPAELSAYNARRADMLMKLTSLAETSDEKAQFLKQCVDGIAAAVQTDTYPEGLARLRQIESEQMRAARPSSVLPFVTYRRIMSEYSVDLKTADTEQRQKIQDAWLKSLEEFVAKFPEADDRPDAMLQVAIAQEFAGKLQEATTWFQRLAKDHAGTVESQKALGAVRRLEMKGKPFSLTSKTLNDLPFSTASYRGKTLLVLYWATWCQPCKEDLPKLRALYQQYQNRGFEIVGVCLDVPVGTRAQQVAQLQPYLEANKVPWPQVYEEGGLNSAPAVQYGVFSLPTMFLIDDKGLVVSRSSSVDELTAVLPQLLTSKQAKKP